MGIRLVRLDPNSIATENKFISILGGPKRLENAYRPNSHERILYAIKWPPGMDNFFSIHSTAAGTALL